MKMQEFFDQLEIIKKVLKQTSEELNCDDIEILFKADDGGMIDINVVEGGYAPFKDTHVLVLSSGVDIGKMIKEMDIPQVVDASDIDVGEKIGEFIDDRDH